jgi:GH24 family phage-related lysozyme (muramidase)
LTDPPITRSRSAALLTHKISEGVHKVLELTGGTCGTNQLIGLVICGFNIGWQALATSTIIKCHRRGDYAAAARAFSLFDQYRPDGPGTPKKRNAALAARRLREAAIYALPDSHAEAPAPVPQVVEPEAAVATKPTVTAAGGAAVVAGGSAVTSVLDGIKGAGDVVAAIRAPLDAIKSFAAEHLGPLAPHSPWLLVMVLCGVVIWQRVQSRRGGWG